MRSDSSDTESTDTLSSVDNVVAPKTTKQSKEDFVEAKKVLDKQKMQDTVDRYKFLLGQTELFSHFIQKKGLLEEHGDSVVASTKGATSRRGRKTEKQEDAELLNDELHEVRCAVISLPYTFAQGRGHRRAAEH